MADWQGWINRLEAADDEEVDDAVDDLAARLLASPPDPTATTVVIRALGLSKSDLSVRSAAMALAYIASDDDIEAVEYLEHAFEARRQNEFLAPFLLGALSLLGLRNESARLGAGRFLQRFKASEPRSLLVAAAKAIGLLCDRRNDETLRARLFALAGSDDVAVRAEARQQIALMRLADALLAESYDGLIALLAAAREAFLAAEGSEETRPDASLFRLLLDAVLQFHELERDRVAAAERIKQVSANLREMGGQKAEQIFQMDRSPAASQIANRCEIVASSLEAAAKEVANAARWTNFDRSVVRLAECYGDIRYRFSAIPGYEQAAMSISAFADRVIKPRLGPVLARKVGRESFAEVIRHYEAESAKPEVLLGLQELQRAVLEAEMDGRSSLSEEAVGTLRAMAEKAGCSPEELIGRINLQIEANEEGELGITAGLMSPPPSKRGKTMPLPTIGIIVALAEEFDTMRAMISNEHRYRSPGPGGGREYLLGDIPSIRKGIHQVVIAQTMDMGNTSAASRASKMLMDFDGIDHVIMCGIGGGVPHPTEPPEHVRLGDIVVSNRKGVIQYDFGKPKGEAFEERFAPRPPSATLLEAVQMLEQDKLSGKRPWDAHLSNGLAARSLVMPNSATDVILDHKGNPIEHPLIAEARPRVFLGPIASANVVQGDFRKRDLLRDQHKVKAVEMEGYGVADATWEYEKAGYLVVRGVCDYCDVRTKHLQTDAWKRYAAMASAAYVRALIEAMPGTQRRTTSPSAMPGGSVEVT
jgi:nucleoside phosphorylase